MLSFFKKIRRNSILNSKTTRYLKYAAGEVLLVVIGILLALQLNNYKEQRNNEQREKEFLKAINVEFKENRAQFDTVLAHHRADMKHLDEIIKLFPIQLQTAVLDTLKIHLEKTFSSYTFNPSQGSINSLLNTSSFNLIQNDSLRNYLISWGDVVSDYSEDEVYSKNFQLLGYENYFMDHFDFNFNFNDDRFNPSVLQSLKFEYIIKVRRTYIESIILSPEIEILDKAINDIIRFTDPYL